MVASLGAEKKQKNVFIIPRFVLVASFVCVLHRVALYSYLRVPSVNVSSCIYVSASCTLARIAVNNIVNFINKCTTNCCRWYFGSFLGALEPDSPRIWNIYLAGWQFACESIMSAKVELISAIWNLPNTFASYVKSYLFQNQRPYTHLSKCFSPLIYATRCEAAAIPICEWKFADTCPIYSTVNKYRN